jgi:hypothetical protein
VPALGQDSQIRTETILFPIQLFIVPTFIPLIADFIKKHDKEIIICYADQNDPTSWRCMSLLAGESCSCGIAKFLLKHPLRRREPQ